MNPIADLEAPRPALSDAFSDAVTIAFGDSAAGLYGTLRLGLAGGSTASGLVLLFHDGELATVSAEGGLPVDDPSSWGTVSAAGLDMETIEPLRRWRAQFAGDDASLDLEIESSAPPCELLAGDAVAKAGGMLGFDQPVRVRGSAQVNGRHITVDAVGQRGRSWGAPDWTSIQRTRVAGAWFQDGAVSLSAILPEGSRGHGDEAISAVIFDPASGDEGFVRVGDPRLSTTFDAEGRQQRAALELWVTDDGPPRRLWGEVVCGTTLDLGRLRLDCSFVRWRMDGREGVGRYDVLRRAPQDDEPA